MATSKRSARQTRGADEWSWEDFRPEWAMEGIERISEELEKWTDDLQTRSDRFRVDSQKRIDRAVKQVQDELRKLPGMERAEELRKELGERVEQNIESGVDRLYTSLRLARLDEVKKLERKISQLNAKLRKLESKRAA